MLKFLQLPRPLAVVIKNHQMNINVLWTGPVYNSLENCLLSKTGTGIEVNAVIIGVFEGKIYRIEYSVKTNQ
jgi:hypothetical protein